MSSPFLGERDFLNAQLGYGLAVAVAPSHAFLRLVSKGDDFRALALPYHTRGDLSGGDQRRSHEKIGACVREENTLKNNFVIRVAFDAVKADNVAFLNLKLPSVGFDDGEHGEDPFKRRLQESGYRLFLAVPVL